MKQLFVIRHAKSSWEQSGQTDFDRPLNDRGLRDAPMMAKRLWDNGIRIDAIISSPAVRALTTAEFFAKQFGLVNNIITLKHLYHASAEIFYDVIENNLNEKWESVAIFSHNPGISYFVDSLNVIQLDNMPTCGVMGVRANIKTWRDFTKAEKEFLIFEYPKKSA